MENKLILITIFLVTVSVTFAEVGQFGKLLGRFPGNSQHDVAGTIYVVDEDTIYVRGFSYDGTAPDAFFYAGDTDDPSGNGVIIPDEEGTTSKLGEYNNQNLILNLPSGRTINSFKWISIWCRRVGVNFGHVNVDASLVPPAQVSLGELGFSRRVHNVHADDVIILNPRQVRFVNLDYDGAGPAAYFWVDMGATPTRNGQAVRHPDDTARDRLPRYNGADVTVTLPAGKKITDYGNIGLWCEIAFQNFGHVVIQGNFDNLPPYLGDADEQIEVLPNCKVLMKDRFHISWERNEAEGKLKLKFIGVVARGEYLSFGISGSDSETNMVGSDVIVAYVDEQGTLHADDYYLNDRSQCSPTSGGGACPDDLQGGNNNVTGIERTMKNGITTMTVERPLAAADDKDSPIPNGQAFISWGIGEINPSGHAAKHSLIPSGNEQIDFSQESSTCERFTPPKDSADLEPWQIEPITPKPAPEKITAHIGPAGGSRGYQGIAGQVGWGIAWYLNGQLVPELRVRRNCTYRFEIFGGNDSSSSLANFHPFYITNDKDGGYNQKTPEEKQGETIYAGPVGGDLCQYESNVRPDRFDDYATFEDFKKTLTLDCPASAEPGILEWFVELDTPDTLYYQCYQHRFFGWKIMVTDSATSITHHLSLMVLLVTIAAFFGRY